MFWIKKDRLNSLSVRTFESQYWTRTDKSQLLNYNATLLAATLLAMPIADKFEFQHYSILAYPSGVLSTSNFFDESIGVSASGEFLQQGEFQSFFGSKQYGFTSRPTKKGYFLYKLEKFFAAHFFEILNS